DRNPTLGKQSAPGALARHAIVQIFSCGGGGLADEEEPWRLLCGGNDLIAVIDKFEERREEALPQFPSLESLRLSAACVAVRVRRISSRSFKRWPSRQG